MPVVILSCRAGAGLFRRIGQPPVVGEIAVGVLLGPSLLGWLWPSAQQWLFPESALPFLDALGNLGLLAFMFLVGLELDPTALRGNSRAAVAISQTSIVLPMALGVLLALGMYGALAPDGVDRLPFALFIAVSMSITAFPVLARILVDRDEYRTPMGALAMTCAAVDDVTAWCLLAGVVAVATSGSPAGALVTAASAVVFLLLMLCVVRPLLARWAKRAGRSPDSVVLVALFSALCVSALITEEIGVHALFGAFLLGTVTPRGCPAIERSAGRMRAFVMPVLLPLFFVVNGLRTDLSLLVREPTLWLWFLAVLGVAVLGKWGGGAGAARLAGRPWRDAMSIGALMNCRGLTELVVLNIGLGLGVIGPDLFTVLVLMALVTTTMTTPALLWLRRSSPTPVTSGPTGPTSVDDRRTSIGS
ncbi:cation:proton antiporter [Streptomyces sp. TRM43335]|uniref:Cation:proton antiporter n=1 Tax=Streptomyces taklimakanensis TaxID=2569853 RepID=A0A6G2BFE6_9ACTN|nr:cation:proton antiporter [Streptomyces taklimakanensis]